MIPSYTVSGTLTLGVVLVALTFGFFFLFKKLKIKLNNDSLVASFLWVLLSAIVRVSEDAGIYPNNFFTVSPGIILLFAIIIIPLSLVSCYLEKKFKIDFWKSLGVFALVGILIHIPLLYPKNVVGALMIIALALAILAIIFLINLLIKLDVFSISALEAHLFDASATFVSINFFGYNEKHIIPTFLINLFGPAAMFLLKLAIVIPVILVINKYSDDEYLRKFLLLSVFVIGLAPALRDTLRLFMGV
jgi:uncharacterized membrane protein